LKAFTAHQSKENRMLSSERQEKKRTKERELGRSEVEDGDMGRINTKSNVGGRGW
jgi:hypothetical protein